MEKIKETIEKELKNEIQKKFDKFMSIKDKEEQFKMYARYVTGTTSFDNIIAFVQDTNNIEELQNKKDELLICVASEINKYLVAGLSLGYTKEKNKKDK